MWHIDSNVTLNQVLLIVEPHSRQLGLFIRNFNSSNGKDGVEKQTHFIKQIRYILY